ncbi:hypothetical protein [Anatilimnocola floriformis]|uniref:hypothetical protein n=1 Tax=Anatilimnocola floriformis TaxID=2948575 RepID=UPI0020C49E9F|nr:hypothetical protein [Anatilimnocola floriformis]
MKQLLGWPLLLFAVLALALWNRWETVRIAQEATSLHDQSKQTEQAVAELRQLTNQLQTEQARVNQSLREMLVSETPWTTSADGQVQVKLTAATNVNRPGEPMTVTLAVRNNHDQPLTVDSSSLLMPWDTHLTLDGQRVRYAGPIPSPLPPTPTPLQPGAIARFDLQLDVMQFPDLANRGVFEVTFTYVSNSPDCWQGSVGPVKARWENQ